MNISEIKYIPEEERAGKLCAHFSSPRATTPCGKQAVWMVHEVYETTIVRNEQEIPTSYDIKIYYCDKHGVH